MLQKTAPANKRWFLRCLFSNLSNETETISLAIFYENVKAMVDLVPEPNCLSSVAPNDLGNALILYILTSIKHFLANLHNINTQHNIGGGHLWLPFVGHYTDYTSIYLQTLLNVND